jgi:hypothetical protein
MTNYSPLQLAARRLCQPLEINQVARQIRRSPPQPSLLNWTHAGNQPEKDFDMPDYPTTNPELIGLARTTQTNLAAFARPVEKRAFVPGGDPAAAAGGAPPGGDPAAMGGAPPPDPMMGGGAPPPDPMTAMMPMIQQMIQQAMASSGAGAGGAGGQEAMIKPKIDVNIEIMQIKKMLAKISDAMGIHIPAQDMVATPEDLTQMAMGGPGNAAATPDSPPSAIKPISPMGAAMPGAGGGGKQAADRVETGRAFDNPFRTVSNKAQAIIALRSRK